MGTEIGARNLADEARYNTLPKIAQLFGYDQKPIAAYGVIVPSLNSTERFYTVLIEMLLRLAITTHLADNLKNFGKNESDMNRTITGDWTWLIPPISASRTQHFHKNLILR